MGNDLFNWLIDVARETLPQGKKTFEKNVKPKASESFDEVNGTENHPHGTLKYLKFNRDR